MCQDAHVQAAKTSRGVDWRQVMCKVHTNQLLRGRKPAASRASTAGDRVRVNNVTAAPTMSQRSGTRTVLASLGVLLGARP